MIRRKLGQLDAVVTGGVDREGGGEGPVVVLLHGFGAPGEDLVSLWRVMDVPREVRWVFPAAPLSLAEIGYPPGSRAWWHLDLERVLQGDRRAMVKDVPGGLAAAREAVSSVLAEVRATMRPSALVLGGFSQGAMLSLDVALQLERLPLALLSGTIIAEDEWDALMPERVKDLPIFQSHGQQDPLLPFSLAESLHQKLAGAGAVTELLAFRGGHEIPARVLSALSTWLRGVISAP